MKIPIQATMMNLLIKVFFVGMLLFLGNCKENAINKTTNEKKEKNFFLQEEFLEVFSAEGNHWMTYPKSWASVYYDDFETDTVVLITNPSKSISIKKWFNTNGFQLKNYTIQGDSVLGFKFNPNEVFKSEIDIFLGSLKSSGEEIVSILNINPLESKVTTKKGKNNMIYKIMLCDIPGGTHSIVFLKVKFLNNSKLDIVEKIVTGFRKGTFIKKKQ